MVKSGLIGEPEALSEGSKEDQEILISAVQVVGVTFLGRQKYLEDITEDDDVELEKETDNPYDKNAIKVLVNGNHVGYLSRCLAEYLSQYGDYELSAMISEIIRDPRCLGLRLNLVARKP